MSAAGCMCGLVLHTVCGGIAGLWSGAAGILVPAAILFPLFLFRMLGSGDIKLLSAAGSFFGPAFALRHIAVSFIVGAVLSFCIMLKNRSFSGRLQSLTGFLKGDKERIRNYYDEKKDQYRNTLHFSVPVLIAYVVTAGRYY